MRKIEGKEALRAWVETAPATEVERDIYHRLQCDQEAAIGMMAALHTRITAKQSFLTEWPLTVVVKGDNRPESKWTVKP